MGGGDHLLSGGLILICLVLVSHGASVIRPVRPEELRAEDRDQKWDQNWNLFESRPGPESKADPRSESGAMQIDIENRTRIGIENAKAIRIMTGFRVVLKGSVIAGRRRRPPPPAARRPRRHPLE
ncbi:hypothetical protein EVAR_51330_1 [Eumeta japonica]|uniref:Uncharacterized protein n=1 Tax=Eumeta variegata TaxID=151549 RepID=A0A4C1Y0P2_EUMVA|nr:hypothetical protein EVAR_51330_1 [Eumeta japonica]